MNTHLRARGHDVHLSCLMRVLSDGNWEEGDIVDNDDLDDDVGLEII